MSNTWIGITGPTGAGKGEVARILAKRLDAEIVDADRLVDQLYRQSGTVAKALKKAFGKQILQSDGSVNKNALGKIVFADPKQLEKLNSTVLPVIVREILEEMQRLGERVILDAPTLVESGLHHHCQWTVAVLADEDLRLRRIMARDGLDIGSAQSRMRAQHGDDFYSAHCDDVIFNCDGFEKLEDQVDRLLNERRRER